MKSEELYSHSYKAMRFLSFSLPLAVTVMEYRRHIMSKSNTSDPGGSVSGSADDESPFSVQAVDLLVVT